jgi:hypothetical protein
MGLHSSVRCTDSESILWRVIPPLNWWAIFIRPFHGLGIHSPVAVIPPLDCGNRREVDVPQSARADD